MKATELIQLMRGKFRKLRYGLLSILQITTLLWSEQKNRQSHTELINFVDLKDL
jgi:hypothetical protein